MDLVVSAQTTVLIIAAPPEAMETILHPVVATIELVMPTAAVLITALALQEELVLETRLGATVAETMTARAAAVSTIVSSSRFSQC